MADNSYTKHNQIARSHRIHRNPERLRALLHLKPSQSSEESQMLRFGLCSVPNCHALGTESHPLDLHHIIPRSQSIERIHDHNNHLYLCGDFFPNNHHKALHGEATKGKNDWIALGIFGDWAAEEPCEDPANSGPVWPSLLHLAQMDRIAAVLLKSNIDYALDYAIKKNVLLPGSTVSSEDILYIQKYIQDLSL